MTTICGIGAAIALFAGYPLVAAAYIGVAVVDRLLYSGES